MSVDINFTKINFKYLTKELLGTKNVLKNVYGTLLLLSFDYVTEFAWLVEPEGMPAVEHETEGDNDE